MVSTEEKILGELGIDLTQVTLWRPKANYASVVRSGNLLHLAGHIAHHPDGSVLTGQICTDRDATRNVMDATEGYAVARSIGIALLKTLHETLGGNLAVVRRIIKINGLVRTLSPDFSQHSRVIDGVSDLMVAVFGRERGIHARCALGVHSLPFNAPIEIDMLVEISECEGLDMNANANHCK